MPSIASPPRSSEFCACSTPSSRPERGADRRQGKTLRLAFGEQSTAYERPEQPTKRGRMRCGSMREFAGGTVAIRDVVGQCQSRRRIILPNGPDGDRSLLAVTVDRGQLFSFAPTQSDQVLAQLCLLVASDDGFRSMAAPYDAMTSPSGDSFPGRSRSMKKGSWSVQVI
jgi:hypothetical protein